MTNKSLNWTKDQIDNMVDVDAASIESAKVRIRKTNPKLADLLEAEEKEDE
jgi:hypothetical protein